MRGFVYQHRNHFYFFVLYVPTIYARYCNQMSGLNNIYKDKIFIRFFTRIIGTFLFVQNYKFNTLHTKEEFIHLSFIWCSFCCWLSRKYFNTHLCNSLLKQFLFEILQCSVIVCMYSALKNWFLTFGHYGYDGYEEICIIK